MSQELFVIERKPELNEKEKDTVAYLRDKLSTAESLGLTAQAKSIKADIATMERGRLITTAPMTDTELTIWQAWLPTIYSDITDDKRHQLANYHFDRVPQPVLKMWEKHKQSGAFERFEIWTPENPRPDPILVGVNGNARHLLARWGESDANLISFDDIKRELVRRWLKNEDIDGESFFRGDTRTFVPGITAMVGGFFFWLLSFFVALSLGFTKDTTIEASVVLGIAALVSIFIYMRRRLTKKLWTSSPLMQAIAKDTSRSRALLPVST